MKDTFEKNINAEMLEKEVNDMLEIQRKHSHLTDLLKAKKVVVLDLFKQNGLGKITFDNKSVVLNKATKIKKVNYQQVIISIVDSGKIPESVVNSIVEQNTTFTEKKEFLSVKQEKRKE